MPFWLQENEGRVITRKAENLIPSHPPCDCYRRGEEHDTVAAAPRYVGRRAHDKVPMGMTSDCSISAAFLKFEKEDLCSC